MNLSNDQKDEIVSFTRELIKHAETSGLEHKTAASVYKKMNELGYDSVHIDKFGSVIGVLKGKSPGPTLLLDGHMDVVPVRDNESWDYPPFGAEISNGRIWGRGTADMKGALAAMICAPSYLDRSQLMGNIMVSASVAEELLIGTALNHILDVYPVDAVIIGEPTDLKLGHAEKGRASVDMICHGISAHSSRPELGDNAIYRMMKAVEAIRTLPRRRDNLLGDEIIELVEISSLPLPGNGSIPEKCRALWECRLLPGESEKSFIERWQEALKWVDKTEIIIAEHELASYTGQTMTMRDFLPGWLSEKSEKGITQIAAESLKELDIPVRYYAAPFGCNALISAAYRNIPTVILGPGDISAAHKPNENILIKDLLDSARIYGSICQKFTSPNV